MGHLLQKKNHEGCFSGSFPHEAHEMKTLRHNDDGELMVADGNICMTGSSFSYVAVE